MLCVKNLSASVLTACVMAACGTPQGPAAGKNDAPSANTPAQAPNEAPASSGMPANQGTQEPNAATAPDAPQDPNSAKNTKAPTPTEGYVTELTPMTDPNDLGQNRFTMGEIDDWQRSGDVRVLNNAAVAGGKVARLTYDGQRATRLMKTFTVVGSPGSRVRLRYNQVSYNGAAFKAHIEWNSGDAPLKVNSVQAKAFTPAGQGYTDEYPLLSSPAALSIEFMLDGEEVTVPTVGGGSVQMGASEPGGFADIASVTVVVVPAP